MSMHMNHSYHLVTYSPWRIIAASSIMIAMMGFIKFSHEFNVKLMLMGIMILNFCIIPWWRDVREGTFQGFHTKIVMTGLRWGMILFIISEIFLFISFFWTFYHSSLAPAIELGSLWPPLGIIPFNAFQVSLLNTTILFFKFSVSSNKLCKNMIWCKVVASDTIQNWSKNKFLVSCPFMLFNHKLFHFSSISFFSKYFKLLKSIVRYIKIYYNYNLSIW